MRLTLIPAVMAGAVLAGCASEGTSSGTNGKNTPTQNVQAQYTCSGKRNVAVTYEFQGDKVVGANIERRGKEHALFLAEMTDGDFTAFTDGSLTWLAAGQVTRDSIATHAGSRLLGVTRGGRNATLAAQCQPQAAARTAP